MKIGIEISCLDQMIRGIGIYTQTLLEALKEHQVHPFRRKKGLIPFSGSVQSLFRTYENGMSI